MLYAPNWFQQSFCVPEKQYISLAVSCNCGISYPFVTVNIQASIFLWHLVAVHYTAYSGTLSIASDVERSGFRWHANSVCARIRSNLCAAEHIPGKYWRCLQKLCLRSVLYMESVILPFSFRIHIRCVRVGWMATVWI